MNHIDTLRVFLTTLSIKELVVLRHEAIELKDTAAKQLIDEEFERRHKTNA